MAKPNLQDLLNDVSARKNELLAARAGGVIFPDYLIDQNTTQTTERNVSQFGPVDSTVDSYKQAAEYAKESEDWAKWGSAQKAEIQTILNNAGDKGTLVALAQPVGAAKIGLLQGGKVQDAISYVTPEMFGASGNGTSDDSQFIQQALDWVTSASFRKLIFSSGKTYRISSPLIATFKPNVIFCEIDMQGTLYPTTSIGSALTIKEGNYSNFKLKVIGDGVTDPNALPNYNLPNPIGAQQAFVIDSCRACKITCEGHGFVGRVLKTQSTGSTKLSFLNIDMRTGEHNCGQAMYLQGADSAYGVIQSAQTQWDIYGSVLDTITDITIQYWEYGASSVNAFNPALSFIKISSAHIDVLAGGQGSGNGTALLIDGGVSITINKLFTTQCQTGLHVIGPTAGSNEINKQLIINAHYSYGSNEVALKLEKVSNIDINDSHYDSVGKYGISFIGVCRDVRINGYIRNPTINCIHAETGSNLHKIFFSGRLYSASGVNLVDLTSATLQYIMFRDVTALSQGGRLLDLPTTHQVVLDGGTWETTGTVLWQNRPSKIFNTFKPVIEARGSSNFPNGSANGATITIPHGLGFAPTDVDVRWVQLPAVGAQIVLTATTDTNFTVTLVTATPLAAQINFRWFANCHLA